MKRTKKGFTIVELVIVIGVIAILSAILIPTFVNLTSKAEDARASQEVADAYSAYIVDVSDGYLDESGAGHVKADPKKQSEVYVVRGTQAYEYNNGWVTATLPGSPVQIGSANAYNGCTLYVK